MSIILITLSQRKNKDSKPLQYTEQIKNASNTAINDLALIIGKIILYNVFVEGKLFKLGFSYLIELKYTIEVKNNNNTSISNSFTLKKTTSLEKSFFECFGGMFTITDNQTTKKLQISNGVFDFPEQYDIFQDSSNRVIPKRKSIELLTPMGGAVKKNKR